VPPLNLASSAGAAQPLIPNAGIDQQRLDASTAHQQPTRIHTKLLTTSQVIRCWRVSLQAKSWSTPLADRQAQHRIEEGCPQWRHGGCLIQQDLKGGSIKVVKNQAVTMMINEQSKIN
jgi:hypothetical protein